MDAAADRPEFAPPPEPALVRAFALAVLAHLVLLFALTLGLRWQRETPNAVAEAELWSALPKEAAPKEVPTPPAPPPPPPQPVVKTPPPPPLPRQPDIAVEREKQRQLEQQRRDAELQRQQEQKRRLDAQKKREQELAKQQELRKQQLAALEEKRKLEEQKRKDEEKKRKEQDAKLAKERERLRQDQLARMQAMAGATGSANARGTAQHSSGPSASWGAKVQALVRPKIVLTDDVPGNPKAEVEVRTSPDGTIVGKRLVTSSGVQAWDQAVLRALDKTDALPRDVDGRVPSPVIIGFRPKA